jgi:hypothetical protein
MQKLTRQPERRAVPRYAFEAQAEIEWGSQILKAQVGDISSKGLLLRVSDPLWVGATFRVHVFLDPPLTLDAVVRRVEPMRAMGVQFLELSPETQQQLEELLRRFAGKQGE